MTLPLCNYLNFPINYSALGLSVLLSTLNYLCFSPRAGKEISPAHSYQTSGKHMTLYWIFICPVLGIAKCGLGLYPKQ
jgi:hypothetical protein